MKKYFDKTDFIGDIKTIMSNYGVCDVEREEVSFTIDEIDNIADDIYEELMKRTTARIAEIVYSDDDSCTKKTIAPEIKCVPGYYEWDVYCGDEIICAIEDPAETITDECGHVCKSDIELLAESAYAEMQEQNARPDITYDDFVNAVVNTLWAYYRED